ncbi:MAG: nucleotidyltransferase domain-containing protein [Anaerolineae bacterium]|nr:nucleotidyltransferase domain-containing protein [Anaerolineae bacterium]
MPHERLGQLLEALKSELETLYGDKLASVILFGSQARGDATDDSDVDILIVLYGEVDIFVEMNRTSHLIANLSLQYDSVISRIFMPYRRFHDEQSRLLQQVRREGILLR